MGNGEHRRATPGSAPDCSSVPCRAVVADGAQRTTRSVMSARSASPASVAGVAVLPRTSPPNTGDKLRSSIACAGFVCFIPLFGRPAPTRCLGTALKRGRLWLSRLHLDDTDTRRDRA
jgi:hypothetical protein